MRTGSIISALLHILVVALAYFGLPWLSEPPPANLPVIDVELVQVAEKTNLPARQPEPKKEPKKEPKPKPKPKPKAVAAPPPPPPPPPEPEPQPKPAPEPKPVVKPKPAPKAEPKPEPIPEAKPKPKPKPKPTPRPKPKPKPKPKPVKKPEKHPPKKKKPAFDPNRIAALLDKRAKQAPAPVAKEEPKKRFDLPELRASTTAPAPTLAPRLTISDIDYLRQQIQKCWTVPAGARDAGELVVRLRITLNPDGSLRGAPKMLDAERIGRPGQEFFRAAAESARRAVLQCAPYKMPREKYERWRDIVLTFDPREMLGG